jgi:hypothetical protein
MIYENWHGKHSVKNLILYIVQTKMDEQSILFLYRTMSALRRLKQSQFFWTLYLHVHFE